MDGTKQEAIKLSLETDRLTVAPGGRLDILLVLTNLRDTPDQVRIMAEGIPLEWISTEQPEVILAPRAECRVCLTIQSPAPPAVHPGRYSLTLRFASRADRFASAEVKVSLTVAAFEIEGRVGVLLDTLRYSLALFEQLIIPVVLINQGVVADTFQPAMEGLPEGWYTLPSQAYWLETGEVASATLTIQPDWWNSARAGRHPFHILLTSGQWAGEYVGIDCTVTIVAFVGFNCSLEAAVPDQQLPKRVRIENFSNMPATFQVSWTSPENALVFEPDAPQTPNLSAGQTSELEYSAAPARPVWFGSEKSFPYSVTVQAPNRQIQILDGVLVQKARLPV